MTVNPPQQLQVQNAVQPSRSPGNEQLSALEISVFALLFIAALASIHGMQLMANTTKDIINANNLILAKVDY